MSELRRDSVSNRWVMIAQKRAERPDMYGTETPLTPGGPCVFCPGQEHLTPPELAAWRDGRGWRTRVIPNKYPAIGDAGAHEVIIEAAEHVRHLTEVSDAQVVHALSMYQERLRSLRRDQRFAYGLIFKNVGPRAGATQEHTHAQLLALPMVPARVQEEIDRAQRHFDEHRRCIFCDLVAHERKEAVRIVAESDAFLALAPFAPVSAFETHVLPKQHIAHFEETTEEGIGELAVFLRTVLTKIHRVLEDSSYNYFVHTSPWTAATWDHYHWHLEIIPRTTGIGGFEWGAGFYINAMPPEEAARRMREALEP